MNLKFLFAAISFCWFAFLALKWWRSRTSLSGNEMIVLPVALAPVVLFPGDYSVCAMRMALFSSMFGGYILWSAMLKRGRKPEIPVFVYALPGIFLYEAAVWIMDVERVAVFKG